MKRLCINASLAVLLAAVAAVHAAGRSYIVRLRDHAEPQHVDALASFVTHRHRDARFSRHTGTLRQTFAHRMFKGFTVSDVSPAMYTELLNHPLVDRIYPDSPRQAAATSLPWGLDRLDQQSLPLDGAYRPQLNGEGVNAFILDSGIDTLHDEFQNSERIVKNIYDHYIKNKESPDGNNDAYGHGTHVAGILGGRSVGVSPKANVYGVKILDNRGGGTDSTVLAGLLFVADWIDAEQQRTGKAVPAVVCMSLGGSCLFPGCENEIMVDMLGNFTAKGIHMVVAAGNDHCDSCNATPAASTAVVTVGATTNADDFGTYSNNGQCVDVMAPGSSISSACSSKKCSGEKAYQLKTGTSMAAPHVAGVIAHLLSIQPAATTDELRHALLCSAAKSKVKKLPGGMRNLLAQVLVAGQQVSALDWSCDRGAGCPDSCSGHGDCLGGRCICDVGFFGSRCESTSPAAVCASGDNNVLLQLDLISFKAHGWPSLTYTLSTSDGHAVKSGTLACGASSRESICVAPGCYSLATKGRVADVNSASYAWGVCGTSGNVPSSSSSVFCVDEAGNCQLAFPACPHNALTLEVSDAYGDGWVGGSLITRAEVLGSYSFAQPAGGSEEQARTTLAWGDYEQQQLCLPSGLYSLSAGGGDFPEEIEFELCGAQGSAEAEVAVLVNETHCGEVFLQGAFDLTVSTQGYDSTISGSVEALAEAVATEIDTACSGCAFDLVLTSVDEQAGEHNWAIEVTIQLASKHVATRVSVHKLMTDIAQALSNPEATARIQAALVHFLEEERGATSAEVVVTTTLSDSYDVDVQTVAPDSPTPSPAPGPTPSPPSPSPPSPSPSPRRTTKVRASAVALWVGVSVGSVLLGTAIASAVLVARSRRTQGHQRLQQDDRDEGVGDDMVEIELYDATNANQRHASELSEISWWRRWRLRQSRRMVVQLGSPGVTIAEDTTNLLPQAQSAVEVTKTSETEL